MAPLSPHRESGGMYRVKFRLSQAFCRDSRTPLLAETPPGNGNGGIAVLHCRPNGVFCQHLGNSRLHRSCQIFPTNGFAFLLGIVQQVHHGSF